MPAVFDNGDVYVDVVALFERLVIGNTVTNGVVDRGEN